MKNPGYYTIRMRSVDEHNEPLHPSAFRELKLLSEVDASPEVTQRQLAKRLGVALGLTNVMLRNLAQKGYVRITRAGWRSWIYNLTPEGVSRKLRLTTSYVHRVLDHYKEVRQTLREQLDSYSFHSESRVAIYGSTEFAELVYLGLREFDIDEIDFFDSRGRSGGKLVGMPVNEIGLLEAKSYDWIIIAQIEHSEEQYSELLRRGAAAERIITFFQDKFVDTDVQGITFSSENED